VACLVGTRPTGRSSARRVPLVAARQARSHPSLADQVRHRQVRARPSMSRPGGRVPSWPTASGPVVSRRGVGPDSARQSRPRHGVAGLVGSHRSWHGSLVTARRGHRIRSRPAVRSCPGFARRVAPRLDESRLGLSRHVLLVKSQLVGARRDMSDHVGLVASRPVSTRAGPNRTRRGATRQVVSYHS
jgi:hypothetical protein